MSGTLATMKEQSRKKSMDPKGCVSLLIQKRNPNTQLVTVKTRF